jgi:hypothetical protein
MDRFYPFRLVVREIKSAYPSELVHRTDVLEQPVFGKIQVIIHTEFSPNA